MKVFISWSGELGRKLGECLRGWLPAVLQAVKPYFTPSDVEKGQRWSTDIAKELEDSSMGIVCLTTECLQAPWIMFEAGALSKHLHKSRVCTILFGVEATDMKGPLVQFQATKFEKAEIKKLVGTVNDLCGEAKLKKDVFDEVFDVWWPRLEEEIGKVLNEDKQGVLESPRADRELLEEILQITRFMAGAGKTRTGRVNPRALWVLSSGYAALYETLTRDPIDREAADLLLSMKPAIEHILDLTGVPEGRRAQLADKIQSLEAPRLRGEEAEDEVPF